MLTFKAAKRRKRIASWTDDAWHVFGLALFVYSLTLAPSVSLWDSGEFIASAARLEVGHPPGAPLYWLLMRVAVMVAPAGCEALACNALSALCCALASMMLARVVRLALIWARCGTWLSRRVAATAAGLSWACACSVWAIATCAEVYGAAAFMALFMLWLALRHALTGSARSLLLLSLTAGLAAGVHSMAWLALPAALAVVGHARCADLSVKGRALPRWAAALAGAAVGSALTALLFWLNSGGALDAPFLIDIFAVNVLGLPVGMGVAVGVAAAPLILMLLAWRGRGIVRVVAPHAMLLSLGFMLSLVPMLRAQQGVGVNVGAPADAQSLVDYQSRRQYGNRPLLVGPTYASQPTGVKKDVRMVHVDSLSRYVPREVAVDYDYPSDQLSLLPRMTQRDEAALWAYRVWASPSGMPESIPSFADNLRFLFRYQLGHMMARYLMWNMAGRQNERLGDGGYADGNFVTGIGPVDRARLHEVDVEEDDEQRTELFAIPLLLFVVGFGLAARRRRLWCLLILLFAVAGPALALYVNMPPFEPRERDYIFILAIASLFAFVGVAVGSISESLEALWARKVGAATRAKRIALLGASAVLALALPLFMAAQGWGAQDRSGNRVVERLAVALLDLCPPSSVMLVGGDNDTYPLWYAQEVLGHRRDVRVVNVGLLASPWYVRQLTRASEGAEPLRFLRAAEAANGSLAALYLLPGATDTLSLSEARLASRNEFGASYYLPTQRLLLNVGDSSVVVSVDKDILDPEHLLLLELIDQNPDRRVCAMPDVLPEHLGLSEHLWDIGPVAYLRPDSAFRNPLRHYQLVASGLRLPDAAGGSISADEADQMSRLNLRRASCQAAEIALAHNDAASARNVLSAMLSAFPESILPTDTMLVRQAVALHRAEDAPTARRVLTAVASAVSREMKCAAALAPSAPAAAQRRLDAVAPTLFSLIDALRKTGNDDVAVALADLAKGLGIEL